MHPVLIEKQGERRCSDLKSAAEQSPAKAGPPEQFCQFRCPIEPPEQFRKVEIRSVVHAFTLSKTVRWLECLQYSMGSG
jgi:hypothetical protein